MAYPFDVLGRRVGGTIGSAARGLFRDPMHKFNNLLMSYMVGKSIFDPERESPDESHLGASARELGQTGLIIGSQVLAEKAGARAAAALAKRAAFSVGGRRLLMNLGVKALGVGSGPLGTAAIFAAPFVFDAVQAYRHRGDDMEGVPSPEDVRYLNAARHRQSDRSQAEWLMRRAIAESATPSYYDPDELELLDEGYDEE